MSCQSLALGLRDVLLALVPVLLLLIAASSGRFPGERSLERIRSRRAEPAAKRAARALPRPGRARIPATVAAFALGHPRGPPLSA